MDAVPLRPAAPSSSPPPARPPAFSSTDLFGQAREVIILHGHEEYRLRITRAGKLILTK